MSVSWIQSSVRWADRTASCSVLWIRVSSKASGGEKKGDDGDRGESECYDRQDGGKNLGAQV